MALVAIPQAGLTFHINHGDGSLGPCDASGGTGELGMMTITVTNAGGPRCAHSKRASVRHSSGERLGEDRRHPGFAEAPRGHPGTDTPAASPARRSRRASARTLLRGTKNSKAHDGRL